MLIWTYQLLNAINFTQCQFVPISLRPTRICNVKGIVLTLTRPLFSGVIAINANDIFFWSTTCENYTLKIYNSASSLEAAVNSSSFEVLEDETTNFSLSVWRTLTRTDTFTGPKSGCKRKKFGVLMSEKNHGMDDQAHGAKNIHRRVT